MPDPIYGIHHITAIASGPQRNLDFYTQVLGLRLVKLTVNFDDPGTYHFYFGDAAGHPGTILTFFPWANIRSGLVGAGQVGMVAFSVPPGSLAFWQERLTALKISAGSPFQRFDEQVLTLADPDGLRLELVSGPGAAGVDASGLWEGGPVPPEHALRGFASPTLLVAAAKQTADLLARFGFQQVQQDGPRYRFSAGDGPGTTVDIQVRPDELRGQMGAGVVHHIAWRAHDDAHQLEWREELIRAGLQVTPVLDRSYFHSIYFREPGGILFEIATDPPGFTIDEPLDALGSQLRLPPWLEPRRDPIQQLLPVLRLPSENHKGT